MPRASSKVSLTRRLIGFYLMFVLAGLLACIAVAMVLALRGELLELSPFVIVLPLMFVAGGAYTMYRLVRVNATIEAQLHRISAGGTNLASALARLPDSAPLTHGWNMLVQQVQDHLSSNALNSKLDNFVESFNQQWWELITNSLPDGVLASDQSGKVVRANRSALMFLGVGTEAELLDRDLTDLLANQFPAATRPTLAEFRQGAGILTKELLLSAEVAAGVWRITRTPLLGQTTCAGGHVWIVRDITQQRLAEDARQQFVSTATHELRTPLANIKAYAETLADCDTIDPQEQKNFYNVINGEATRLARFVDDLLNVSQMEAGAITVLRKEVDIERLLSEVTAHVAPQSQQKQQQFETVLPQKYPKLRADKDKLSAALVNLIGNAIKYTPDGGVVRLKVDANESSLNFVVEDNGIGIAPDELPQLCQKFFRSNDVRVRQITGSGLGLAFTQEVAKLHGGSIAVSSELNKGSQFTMSLPLA